MVIYFVELLGRLVKFAVFIVAILVLFGLYSWDSPQVKVFDNINIVIVENPKYQDWQKKIQRHQIQLKNEFEFVSKQNPSLRKLKLESCGSYIVRIDSPHVLDAFLRDESSLDDFIKLENPNIAYANSKEIFYQRINHAKMEVLNSAMHRYQSQVKEWLSIFGGALVVLLVIYFVLIKPFED